MTQEQINRSVVVALEARRAIKELREAGLIKDSYNTIINASLNGIDKKLKKTKPESK